MKRRWAVLLPVALLAACATRSDRVAKVDGSWQLVPSAWQALSASGDRRALHREFALTVQELAGEGEEVSALAPLFRDFGEFLERHYGPEAPGEFRTSFEHSLRLMDEEKIPRAMAEARKRGPVARDVLIEYRIPWMQRSLVTMRAASWGLASRPAPGPGDRDPSLPPAVAPAGIAILSPANGTLLFEGRSEVEVRGEVAPSLGERPGLTLYVDHDIAGRSRGPRLDEDVPAGPVELVVEGGGFRTSAPVRLGPGAHRLTVVARSSDGREATAEVRVAVEAPRRTWALVVGVDTYEDPEIEPLKWCEADARAVTQHLTGNLRVPGENVLLLLHPSRGEILKAFAFLEERMGRREDASLIFYFSGHGVLATDLTGSEQVWLLARDARMADIPGTAVSNQDLAGWLTALRARMVVTVIDSCYSGGLTFTSDLRDRWLGFRPHMLFAASSPHQPSKERDDLRHGLFTACFLDGVGGAADRDGDRRVTGLEAFLWLQSQRDYFAGQDPVLETRMTIDPVLLGLASSGSDPGSPVK
jgi:hypothetical protein